MEYSKETVDYATWGADLLLANDQTAYRRAMAVVNGRIDRPKPTPEQVAPKLRAVWIAYFDYETRAEYGPTRAVDWATIARDWCAERDLQARVISEAAAGDPGEKHEPRYRLVDTWNGGTRVPRIVWTGDSADGAMKWVLDNTSFSYSEAVTHQGYRLEQS